MNAVKTLLFALWLAVCPAALNAADTKAVTDAAAKAGAAMEQVATDAKAAAKAEESHSLPMQAPRLLKKGDEKRGEGIGFQVTNSLVAMFVVAGLLILFAQMATRNVQLVPSGLQNFAEWIVETLVEFLGGIMGEKLARKTFWFYG